MLRLKRALRRSRHPSFLDESEQDDEIRALELASQWQARSQSLALALVLAAASAFFAARVARVLSLRFVASSSLASSALDALAAASLAGSSLVAATASSSSSSSSSSSRRRRAVLFAASLTSASLVALAWAGAFLFFAPRLPPPRFYAWLPFPSLLGALAAWWLSRSIEDVTRGIEEMKRERYRLKGA